MNHGVKAENLLGAASKRASLLISALISIGLLWLLLQYFDSREFVQLAANIPPWLFPIILLFFVGINFARALRFKVLLRHDQLPLLRMFEIVLCYNFLLRLLPLMTGEVSYLALIRHYLQLNFSKGVSSLIVVRIFDLLGLLMLGIAGIYFAAGRDWNNFNLMSLAPVLLLIALVVAICYLKQIARFFSGLTSGMIGGTPLRRFALVQKLQNRIEDVPRQLELIRTPAILLQTLLLTCLIYALTIAMYYFVLTAIGIQHHAGGLIMAIAIAMFSGGIPLSLGGFGLIEGGWALGLSVFAGLSVEQAATIGFLMHAIQMLVNAILGAAGVALLYVHRNKPVTLDPAEIPR